MTKIRLLLIEEHRAVRQALETRLRSSPVVELVSAIASIPDSDLDGRVSSPDVIVLGVKRGTDRQFDMTLARVKRLVSWGAAVVVLTPYADDIEQELLLEAGASRYLLKDINTPQLVAEIACVTAKKVTPYF